MEYSKAAQAVATYREEINALREKIRATLNSREPQTVPDYSFETVSGDTTLSALFGEKDTLLMVHNMGKSCSYCTLWADGLNGVLDHLLDRAAFAVCNGDTPEEQAAFAAERGWRFTMVSCRGNSFASDMEYQQGKRMLPGVSVFRRTEAGIVRVSDAPFGPGDDYCSVWHLFDLIPEGANGWSPKFAYAG